MLNTNLPKLSILYFSPAIHPVLKFFLIALAIIVGLLLLWYKGKEYLFRKRV